MTVILKQIDLKTPEAHLTIISQCLPLISPHWGKLAFVESFFIMKPYISAVLEKTLDKSILSLIKTKMDQFASPKIYLIVEHGLPFLQLQFFSSQVL